MDEHGAWEERWKRSRGKHGQVEGNEAGKHALQDESQRTRTVRSQARALGSAADA